MTFLSWRKDYEVGVQRIDAEHHGLFDLINEFHETHAHGNCRRQTAQVLNRLVAYAEEHFQHEEKLMRDNDYPLLEQHRRQHTELVASIFAINEKLASDTFRASTEILPFIKSWLVGHIIKNDMDIGDFLLRKTMRAQKALADAPAGKQKEKALPGAAKQPQP